MIFIVAAFQIVSLDEHEVLVFDEHPNHGFVLPGKVGEQSPDWLRAIPLCPFFFAK